MSEMNLKDNFLIPRLSEIAKAYGYEANNIKFIGGGSFGRVYKAESKNGTPLILKAYHVRGMQNTESEQLKILSANTSVDMPEVYFTHCDEDVAVLCMSFIEGKNALDASFLLKNKNAKIVFAKSVINGMLEWHSVQNDKFGYLDNATFSTWKEFYNDKATRDLAGLKSLLDNGKFSKKSYDLLCKGLEIWNSLDEKESPPVLIHGDLNIMNIMADPKTFALTGFIDPCGTMWAEREYDLFQLRNMWGDAYKLYETYKQSYELSEHCDFKVALYGAIHENSMRLKGGLVMPVWEIENNTRLKNAMKKYL